VNLDRPVSAPILARIALYTTGSTVQNLAVGDDTFGIGTPVAMKGTAFQKNHRPAARAIMNRKSLDIK
jgi:hypothetical protein